MAVLRNPDGDSEIRTPPRAVIGRGPRSDVRVDDNACSTQHAEVFWSVDRWVVRDLDSRNGTWVDGVRLQPSEQSELRVGQSLAFGNPPRPFTVLDLPDPVACARDPEGTIRFAEHGVLMLPQPSRPEVVLDLNSDGRWWIEHEDERMPCPAEVEVLIDGRRWLVQAPQPEPGTVELMVRKSLSSAQLTFHVSPDEEHVIIDALSMGILTRLEPRAHGYLLLYLAEQRLADRRAGHPIDEEGWRQLEREVSKAMSIPFKDVNVYVYRARRQFAEHQIDGAALLVERRAGELRLGVARVSVIRHRSWPPPDPLHIPP